MNTQQKIDAIYSQLSKDFCPILLNDVIDKLSKREIDGGIISEIIYLWKREIKHSSLLEQSDECIDFIYNLISKKGEI